MANIAKFRMKVVGATESIKNFYDLLADCEVGKGIGRGANGLTIKYSKDKNSAIIKGTVPWCMSRAFISDVEDRMHNLTLWEACEKLGLNLEAYSKEPNVCFQEHFLFKDGKVVIKEDKPCYEYDEEDFEDYDSKLEMEEELGIVLTEKEWKNKYYTNGGYPNWDFHI